MTMPNFLIIGAAKSGTTALYDYLRQHPEIYASPRKETHFFSFGDQDPTTHGPGDTIPSAITTLEAYQSLFQDVKDEKAIGEASPTYIYIPRACKRIQHYLPEAKLIAILRHPAERAFSAYMHVVRDGREPLADFPQALQEEKTRIQNNWGPIWHYTQGGFYYGQLKRYFDTFDRNQIKVYLHQDLNSNPAEVLRDAFQFLDVDDEFVPDMSIRPNVSGVPKSRALQWFLHVILIKPNPIKTLARLFISEQVRWRVTTEIRNRNLVKTQFPSSMRQQLIEIYRKDILKLQELIQRDLSTWLE